MKPLALPDFRTHAVALTAPGRVTAAATAMLGGYLKEVMALDLPTGNMRLFGPDETASNGLQAVYEVTDIWQWASDDGDPEVVLACAGDVPTLETLAAAAARYPGVPQVACFDTGFHAGLPEPVGGPAGAAGGR